MMSRFCINTIKSLQNKSVFFLIILFLLPKGNIFSKYDEMQSFSLQPLGFFFLRTNIEYERKIIEVEKMPLALQGRLNISTQNMSSSVVNDWVDDTYISNTWFGIGTGARVYFGRKMDEYYAGIHLDFMQGAVKEDSDDKNGMVFWLSIEAGTKYLLGRKGGFFFAPSLGLLLPLGDSDSSEILGNFYSIGFAIGYQF